MDIQKSETQGKKDTHVISKNEHSYKLREKTKEKMNDKRAQVNEKSNIKNPRGK